MSRVLVVYCHPSGDSFVASVRDRVTTGLATAGAEVRLTDLYADGFDPLFSSAERANHLVPGTDPSIASYADDLQWCDTLVLVYPTWWSGQPAMLKGWIDRVWVNDVAWTLPDGANRLRPALRNVRRLVAVTTHGSSKWINAIEGESGKRTLTRSLRSMCHPLARTTWVAMYGVDNASDAERRAFLDRVERRIACLA
jgi:putative NADPH-quinone reductase